MEHEQITGTTIGCAMKVHTTLGPGFLESVYHNALTHELRKRGVLVELKKRVVGDYEADMLVEGRVLVENKAIRALAPRDEAQLVNYLTATELDTGLLLNFGAPRLEFKRKSRTYRAATARQDGQDEQDGTATSADAELGSKTKDKSETRKGNQTRVQVPRHKNKRHKKKRHKNKARRLQHEPAS